MDAPYRFGRFEFNLATRQLLADGQPTVIGARAFDVLLALIERRERIVTKDELLDLAWPGLVVEENNLQVQVSTLRKVLGAQAIATIPGRGYQFTLEIAKSGAPKSAAASPESELILPDKPSIAVLPFANMTGDAGEDHFVDGITDDIITDLSRFRSLFVIARNSSFSYKDKPLDLRQVGRELGVRYLLEGGFRRMGDQVRVTAQLIDSAKGVHIWAERYDRTRADIFAVQDDITQGIVTAIAPQIDAAEREKARRNRPAIHTAYEIAVRALSLIWEGLTKAQPALWDDAYRFARQALEVDPRSTLALNVIAFARYLHVSFGTADAEAALREGLAAATRAIELDPADSNGHLRKALLLTFAPGSGQSGEALAHLRTAHVLNPNDVNVLTVLGWSEATAGNVEQGIAYLQQALRLAPRSPLRYSTNANLSVAFSLAKDYASTVKHASLAATDAPDFALAQTMLAFGYVGIRDIEKARAAYDRAHQLAPEYLQKRLNGDVPYERAEDRQRYVRFMRVAAGLDEPSAVDALR
jgi:TolB-like protein/tetratricopeptide (TPR) repeat protein